MADTSDTATSTDTTAVLFADLGDSTRLYERLGDVRAHEIAAGCLERLEEVVAEHGGRIIKHIGDEVMCVFATADVAVSAARDMQERVTTPVQEQELTIHIGLHYGPVLVDRGDVFGDAVNLAARMVALARPRQILTTGATVALLAPELKASTRLIERRHVKGKEGDVDVYELVWEHSDDRTAFKGPTTPVSGLAELRLSVGQTVLVAGDDKPAVTIGRDLSNDLVVPDIVASRHHAKIERRIDKWVFIDHSSNGTVVATDDGNAVLVHNEQILLPSAGWLGIGNPTPGSNATPVRFELLPPL